MTTDQQIPQAVTKSMRLRTDLIKILEERAALENRTFSNMVETLLLNAVK